MTTTGIQFSGDADGTKLLPALTVCPLPAVKVFLNYVFFALERFDLKYTFVFFCVF